MRRKIDYDDFVPDNEGPNLMGLVMIVLILSGLCIGCGVTAYFMGG